MERKEPTLSGIVPERDSDDFNGATASKTRRQPRRPMSPPPAPAEASGPGAVAIMALLLALVSVAGSGYLYWQLQLSQKNMSDASHRIAGLETRLNLNSDQSSQTVDEIQADIKEANSQIRKLWGVSYDTNRGNITDNTNNLGVLKTKMNKAEKKLATVDSNVTSNQQDLQTQIDGLKTQLEQANKAVKTLSSSADTLESLQIDVQRISQQMPGLRNLAARVKTNEEAIAAIDAYRHSVNRDILQLKQKIKADSSANNP